MKVMEDIGVRINCIDTYQTFEGGRRVPVIRIYGPINNDGGEQCVAHVHGAFPFFYLLLPKEEHDPKKYASYLAKQIELALAHAFNRPIDPEKDERVFVKDVTPCKGFDMYGYSVGWNCFLKVRLYNPVHIYKCADLLLSGSVTGFPVQPYETHISFILSFLADYNLYGCDWLVFADDGFHERHGNSKTCHGGREIDLNVESILNRRRIDFEKRHTQVFETQSSEISISSLSEARNLDARWRTTHNIPPWKPQNLQPHYQSLTHNWPWERADEYRRLLDARIEENKEAEEVQNTKVDLDDVPCASELVPTAPNNSQHSESSQLEWILSDDDEDEDTGRVNGGVSKRRPASRKVHSGFVQKKTQMKIKEPELIALFDQLSQSDTSTLESVSQTPLNIAAPFGIPNTTLQFSTSSPSTVDVSSTIGVTSSVPLHFGNSKDVPMFPLKYGGKEHFVKTLDAKDLEPLVTPSEFGPPLSDFLEHEQDIESEDPEDLVLELAEPSPSFKNVIAWQKEQDQLSLPSASNPSENFQFVSLESRDSKVDEMSTCVIEVHVCTRPGKVPKASEDPISAVFWHVSGLDSKATEHGVITTSQFSTLDVPSVVVVESEQNILQETITMVRYFNPDILAGYEVNSSSWGYARARYSHLFESTGDQFYNELSRVRVASPKSWGNFAAVAQSAQSAQSAAIAPPPRSISSDDNESVKGRHLLSLWQCLRKELSLSKYTLEYVVYHILHERIPHYSYDDLTSWWNSNELFAMNSVARYWSQRASLVLKLFAHFEIINRTCEKSRIIGVDFWSSLTRGSQFQVEAVMCRLARRENYILLSPSRNQVGQQNALEFIPLVMEPRSEFYTDPVCVLDFRSLYPSIVIALNLCYSTCIGRVNLWRGRNKLGVKQDHKLGRNLLAEVGADNIYVAPNGIGYVSPKVRKSLLAQMLGEILDTRFMINETRKKTGSNAQNARFQRNMNGKQLALKFIANVTYGYTSASFSGRMPCAELADSIVLAGREILEWCIRTIESCEKWGIKPQVVYGDTDSLFVRLPKTSKSQAFVIGREIADMITAQTPDPINLKLEKVYTQCILLTKKRYVGNSFESEQQKVGIFDAKGIETIRRDGTPIVQKIEKRCLQILFDSSDLSRVKSYLYNQWRDILTGRNIKLQEFCFAQEVKLGHYKTTNGTSNLPGGAIVSLKKMEQDDGFEPQYRERIPFIIAAGPVGSRINDRAVPPEDMMKSPHLMIDSEYYIQKTIIPPLERLFNLLGANIRDWYTKMPRTIRLKQTASGVSGAHNTLNGFLRSEMCSVCLENRRLPNKVICAQCDTEKPRSRYILSARKQMQEQSLAAAVLTCQTCSSEMPLSVSGALHPCQSIDCPIYYEREACKSEHELSLQLLNAMI